MECTLVLDSVGLILILWFPTGPQHILHQLFELIFLLCTSSQGCPKDNAEGMSLWEASYVSIIVSHQASKEKTPYKGIGVMRPRKCSVMSNSFILGLGKDHQTFIKASVEVCGRQESYCKEKIIAKKYRGLT